MTGSRHLGLDLGGTYIKVAVVERAGGSAPAVGGGAAAGGGAAGQATTANIAVADDAPRLIASTMVPTNAARGPDGVAAALVEAGLAAITAHGPIATVGVGVPGLFDLVTGQITLFPNFPGPWPGYPLRDRVAAGLAMPVAFINDARAHTLAETRMGAGRGASTVAMLTLGTGIGGGVVIDGKLHLGATGTAGEIGHQTVHDGGRRCGCGNRGCAEPYAQAGAIMEAAGKDSVEAVFEGAEAGDERCQAAIDTAVDALGIAIANVVTVLVPDRIVLGGGISEAGDRILVPVRDAVERRTPFVPSGGLDLRLAELGPGAGAIGAALAGAEAA